MGGVSIEGCVAPDFAHAAVAIATGNPIGLIVVGGLKAYGEASGRNTLEDRAKATADAIAAQLRISSRIAAGSAEAARGKTTHRFAAQHDEKKDDDAQSVILSGGCRSEG